MSVLTWSIVTRWLGERHQAARATPARIVPVGGLLDVPLARPGLGLPPDVLPVHGVMMFGRAGGLFLAMPLLTRLPFEAPMPHDAAKAALGAEVRKHRPSPKLS